MLKKYFDVYEKNKEVAIKNHVAENVFIIGSSELHWNISTLNKDGLDNNRFQKIKLYYCPQ